MPRTTRNSRGERTAVATDDQTTSESSANVFQYIDGVGYSYCKYRTRGNILYLRCNRQVEFNCNVKARRDRNNPVPITMFPGHVHTHPPPYRELIYFNSTFIRRPPGEINRTETRIVTISYEDRVPVRQLTRNRANRPARPWNGTNQRITATSHSISTSNYDQLPTVNNHQPSVINHHRPLTVNLQQPQENDEICTICLDRMATQTLLMCNHKFCGSCITELVKNNFQTCPLCRKTLSDFQRL